MGELSQNFKIRVAVGYCPEPEHHVKTVSILLGSYKNAKK